MKPSSANYDWDLIMKQLQSLEIMIETTRPGPPRQDNIKPQSI